MVQVGATMSRAQFFTLAADSLLFAQARARAFRIPEAQIELWTIAVRHQ